MVSVPSTTEIEYPESDGMPMAETDLHRDWMVRILEWLKYRYRGQRVYVSSDLFVYFEEDDPPKSVVPDVFVVKDCDPHPRRIFKIWDEGRIPDVVVEVTSRSTRNNDSAVKPQKYATIGVGEYFLYDPTADYLEPPLQGFRLQEHGDYTRIQPDKAGNLICEQLGLCLRLENGRLQMYDRDSGGHLVTESEAEHAARESAEARATRAESEAQRAQRQRQAAEDELRQLRAELERIKRGGSN